MVWGGGNAAASGLLEPVGAVGAGAGGGAGAFGAAHLMDMASAVKGHLMGMAAADQMAAAAKGAVTMWARL